MQHRAILRPTSTGTITLAQALKAARAAKQAKVAGGASSPKMPRVADMFGFGYGPAMGDPKGTTPVRVQKRAAKKRTARKRAAERSTRAQ